MISKKYCIITEQWFHLATFFSLSCDELYIGYFITSCWPCPSLSIIQYHHQTTMTLFHKQNRASETHFHTQKKKKHPKRTRPYLSHLSRERAASYTRRAFFPVSFYFILPNPSRQSDFSTSFYLFSFPDSRSDRLARYKKRR